MEVVDVERFYTRSPPLPAEVAPGPLVLPDGKFRVNLDAGGTGGQCKEYLPLAGDWTDDISTPWLGWGSSMPDATDLSVGSSAGVS